MSNGVSSRVTPGVIGKLMSKGVNLWVTLGVIEQNHE